LIKDIIVKRKLLLVLSIVCLHCAPRKFFLKYCDMDCVLHHVCSAHYIASGGSVPRVRMRQWRRLGASCPHCHVYRIRGRVWKDA